MKHIRHTLARWLARREEHKARSVRRALRDYNRREELAACRADKRARGLRLYAAWSTAPAVDFTPQPSLPGIRAAITNIHLVRRAA